jgi:hypothetical protein
MSAAPTAPLASHAARGREPTIKPLVEFPA